MSMLDKVIAAVTPPESEEKRREARAKAEKRRDIGRLALDDTGAPRAD